MTEEDKMTDGDTIRTALSLRTTILSAIDLDDAQEVIRLCYLGMDLADRAMTEIEDGLDLLHAGSYGALAKAHTFFSVESNRAHRAFAKGLPLAIVR
jgi:predicted RNA-binding protein